MDTCMRRGTLLEWLLDFFAREGHGIPENVVKGRFLSRHML